MEQFVELVYLGAVSEHCSFGVDCAGQIQRLLQAERSNVAEPLFRQAGYLLQHAGMVSKLLWPSGRTDGGKLTRARGRGRYLRTSLGLGNEHPLKSRSLRNHLEHIDERLDDWVEGSSRRFLADGNIGAIRHLYGTLADHEILRHFDTETNEFLFQGERFDVGLLTGGLEDVRARVDRRRAQIMGR